MVRSDADDVEGYLAQVPADRREVLSGLRELCGRLLAGFDEAMRYGMPTYSRTADQFATWLTRREQPGA